MLLFALSVSLLFASFAAVRCLAYPRLVERSFAALLVWTAGVVACVNALGLTNHLTRSNLARASLALSAILLAGAMRAQGRRVFREAAADFANFALLPLRGLRVAFQAKSPVLLMLALVIGVWCWTCWLAYLAPSDGWDGLWYHESMVGFTIQNHGYKLVEASRDVTPINTFPRNCEMISLWFVIFTDKSLIDVVQNVYAVPIVLGTYLIVRRYVSSTHLAIGWACCIFMVPGFAFELRSNYVDVHALSFFVFGLHFGTRPAPRLRDGLLACGAFGLMLGAKSFALAWTPVMGVVAAVWIGAHHVRRRPLASLLTLVGGIGLVLAFGAIMYALNWIRFKNPIWPYQVTIPKLHLTLPGFEPFASTDFNRGFWSVLSSAMAPPQPGGEFPDVKQFGYGLAVPFVILPLSALALGWFVLEPIRLWDSIGPTRRLQNVNLAVTLFTPLTAIAYSPALWLCRYNLHTLVGLFILCAWLGERLPKVAESVVAICAVTGAMWFHWGSPGWAVTFDEAMHLSALSKVERVSHTTLRWSSDPATARAREAEIHAGDVVAFSDDVDFYSVLWNEQFSNRVEYVEPGSPSELLARLDRMNAKWFVTSSRTSSFDALPAWERVGNLSGKPVVAFRRRQDPK